MKENKYPEIYTVLVHEKQLKTWEEDVPDFTIVNKADIWYGENLVLLKITPKVEGSNYTVEDVYESVNALIAHEEYTSGFFTDEENVEKLDDYYGWEGAGWTLIGDMLTEGEKVHILLKNLKELTGEQPILSNITFTTDSTKIENKTYKPLVGNVKELLGDNITQIKYKPRIGAELSIEGWWAPLVENLGLYIIILEEDAILDEDEYEDEDLIPLINHYSQGRFLFDPDEDVEDDDYIYDDDGYIDAWYRKKGLI